MKETALRLRGVSKRFYLSDNLRRESAMATTYRLLTGESEHRPIWAVKEISFELSRGEILGVIGPNGAGKSTLLLLAAQIIEPTEGIVEVYGRTSSFFQLAAGLSPKLSVMESFELTGALLGMTPKHFRKLLPQIIDFSGLEEFLYAKYGELSSGMAARVAFSTAVHADLDIILVDEGMSVGDESFQNKCREKLDGLRKEGKTFIIVSHELDKISSMAKRVLYLNRGYPVFLGDSAEAVERMRRDFGLTTEIDENRKQALGFVNQIPEKLQILRKEVAGDVASCVREEISRFGGSVVRELEEPLKKEIARNVAQSVQAESLRLKASIVEEIEAPLRHHMDDLKARLASIEKVPHQESEGLRRELLADLETFAADIKARLASIESIPHQETQGLKNDIIADFSSLRNDMNERFSRIENAPHQESLSLKQELQAELDSLRAAVHSILPELRKELPSVRAGLVDMERAVRAIDERMNVVDKQVFSIVRRGPLDEVKESFSQYMGLPADCVFLARSADAAEALNGLLGILLAGRDSSMLYSAPEGYVSGPLGEGGWRVVPVARDTESFGPSVAGLERAFAGGGEKPSVVVCQHVNAILPRMDEIVPLCRRNQAVLVEDMSGLLGASLHGKKMGDFDSLGFLDCSDADAAVPLWDTAVFFASTLPAEKRAAVEKLFASLNYEISAETAKTAASLLLRMPSIIQARQVVFSGYAGFFDSLPAGRAQAQKASFGVLGAPESFCFMLSGGEKAASSFAQELLSRAAKTLDEKSCALLQRRLNAYGGGILAIPLDLDPKPVLALLKALL